MVNEKIIKKRFKGNIYKINPAFELLGAIFLTNAIGVIGLLITAPLVATIQVILSYTNRKMLDLDPWPYDDKLPNKTNDEKTFFSSRMAYVKTNFLKKRKDITDFVIQLKKSITQKINPNRFQSGSKNKLIQNRKRKNIKKKMKRGEVAREGEEREV